MENTSHITSKRRIRIETIALSHIKNIEQGSASFKDGNLVSSKGAGILGVFGQNGSGKTALIDAVHLFKDLVSGEPLDAFSSFLINVEKKEGEVEITTHLSDDNDDFLVHYHFRLALAPNNHLRISQESLDYQNLKTKQRKHNILKSESLIDHVVLKKGGHSLRLLKATNLDHSIIFNPKNLEEMVSSLSEEEQLIIRTLQSYARDNILIINNFSNRDFRTKDEFPLIYYASVNGNHQQIMRLKYGSNHLSEEDFHLFDVIVTKISQLLDKILPGIKLTYQHHEKDRIHIVELMTNRDGVKLPLKYESVGVKKLVLVLGALISMYNSSSVFVAIDEIDAGIFEYLLGEIFIIIKEEGLGQLLFTSHNLRPLEILNPYQVIFTSNNPKNRYVSLKKKPHTNLRDLYLRLIELGGQKHDVYQTTDQYEISRAFRLAGDKE